jgi:prolyl oligopeptidase
MYVYDVSSKFPLLYYKDLKNNSDILPLIDQHEAYYSFIENTGDELLIKTNYESPNYQIIKINPQKRAKIYWQTVIPESQHMLYNAYLLGDKILTSYLKDVTALLSVFDVQGNKRYDIDLPGPGRVYQIMGRKDENELFYSYTSYTTPPEIYRYDIKKNKAEIFKKPAFKVDLGPYETQLKFYTSKDVTKSPLCITHKKGLNLNGENAVLLYGYGGYNIPMRPYFSVTRLPLLESGFVYAMACLRGGNEYGENWHQAGMLDKKQNVFDDFIAAAEFLIEENYTNPKKLAIMGASNGGLLVGACINQRPDLFAVALPDVGVMDMLRFQKFTIGWAWVSEYGSSEDSSQFQYLYQYSPLHNIRAGLNYPATLITTADHDDRVFPAHSYKYAATMQEKYQGDNPILLRVETKTGHGLSKTTSTISRYADTWAFMFYNMGLEPKVD